MDLVLPDNFHNAKHNGSELTICILVCVCVCGGGYTYMVQSIEHCAASLEVLVSKLAHTCVCRIYFLI